MSVTCGEIAERFGLKLAGDAGYEIHGACSLANGKPNRLSFLGDKRYAAHLKTTQAGAVIVRESDADIGPSVKLISANPALDFARVATLFEHQESVEQGIHPSATVADNAQVDTRACIGPQVCIGKAAVIEAGAVIGPGCVIGDEVHIGPDSRLVANVTVIGRSRIGARALLLPSCVIGARGFGLIPDANRHWQAVPQLGRVIIGDDVEIGAGTTIDRGAIDDTVIENGCKIDNHIHIAHNCRIGEHTVAAGWTGVAGSTTIGKHCMIAGGVGIADNLSISDNTVVTAMTMVSSSITEPGVYSSGWSALPRRDWIRVLRAARSGPEFGKRLKQLEAACGLKSEDKRNEENTDG